VATKPHTLDAVKILPEVVRRLLTIQGPDDLLPEVLSLCRTFIKADEVSLLLLERDGKEMVEHTVSGVKLRPTRHRVRVGLEGVTGWVAGKQKAQIVPDVRKDSRYVQVDPKRRSEAAIPIMSGDRLLGVLNCESNQQGYFKKTDRPLLEFLAAQISIALRVMEVKAAENGLRDKLAMLHHMSRLSGGFMPTDQFLGRVTDVVRRTLGCYYVGIFQGDYDRQEVVLLAQACEEPINIKIGATQKFGAGLIGKAFELGEVVHARDVTKEASYIPRIPNVKAEASIPIRVGDNCLGILDAQAVEVGGFSMDDMMVLETIARFLVPTLHSAKVGAE